MTDAPAFDFHGDGVATSYDERLVPVLFEPWALRLADEHGPWEGLRVLDLATGTGVVARRLAGRVGPGGHVVAADLNAQMLAVARERCAGEADPVTFVQTPADALDLETTSVDVVVCQQGIQFFRDRAAAVREAFRVLRPGGRIVATAWLPVEACSFFGSICAVLEELGEHGISKKMRIPFDHVPEGELAALLGAAGFVNVDERVQEGEMRFAGGVDQVLWTVGATPIGPDLRDLPDETRAAFDARMTERLATRSHDGTITMPVATRLVTGDRPG